jgi:TP901 family phage tail tape measure protein
MANANMRLKLFLQMINNLGGPSREARKDLKGVRTEAEQLKRAGTGDKLANDLGKISTRAKAARRDMQALGKAAKDAGSVTAAPRDGRGRYTRSSQASKGAAAEGGSTVLAGGKKALAGFATYYAGREAIRRTVGEAISFDKAMAEVKKKVDLPEGGSWSEVERLITRKAIDVGQSRGDMAALTAELGAAGIGYGELAQYMDMASRAAVAWDMPLAETTEKLMKMKAGLQYTAPQLEDAIDKINALSDAGASKERDVVEMQGRSAAAAKASGVQDDTSLAFLTGMNSVGIQPEIASRAFNTIVSKLRTAKSGGNKNMQEGLKMLGMTPAQMETGMKTDAQKTLLDFMDRFTKSTDRAAVGVKVFGEGFWDEFARMADAAPEILKYIKLLSDIDKWKGSSRRNIDIKMATTAAQLERLKTLASDIGDRLGRWALPPINDGIQKIIDKLRELDADAEHRKARDEAVRKAREGTPLTPAEQEAVAADDELSRRVKAAAFRGQQGRDADAVDQAIKGMSGTDALDEHLKNRRRGLEREIAALEADGKNRTPAQKARLARMRGEASALPEGAAPVARFNHRPADQDDRERGIGDVEYMKRAVDVLADRLKRLTSLAANQPRDEGMQARIRASQQTLDERERQSRGTTSSLAFGAGFRSRSEDQQSAGGVGRFDFGRNLKERYHVDLAPEGGLIMESLRRGLEAGKGQAESTAEAARDGIQNRFSGMDLTSEGQRAMETLAAGIRAGEGAAVNAATQAKGRILAALNGGGSGPSLKSRAGGALHDGVTGQ